MRIDVEKILIAGPLTSKDQFLVEVQKLGILEFIAKEPLTIERPREIEMLMDAIHILKGLPKHAPGQDVDFQSPEVVAAHIVETNEGIEHERERVRYLEKEIARIEVFGNFSLGEIADIERETKRHLQFFFAREQDLKEIVLPPEIIYVGSRFGLLYFISLSKERIAFPPLIEMKIDQPLNELYSDLANSTRRIDALEIEIATHSSKLRFLEEGLVEALNRFHLKTAEEKTATAADEKLFFLEGWIPKNKIKELTELQKKVPFYFSLIQKEEGEQTPTYLENKGIIRSGEDLINIYDTPSNFDRDPSPFVIFAFALFFSMIISDAGYGLILLAVSLFLKRKFKEKKGMTRRILQLSTFLSIGCIIWGVLAAGYFGIPLAPDNPLRSVSLIDFLIHEKATYVIHDKPPLYEHLVKEHPEIESKTETMEFLKAVKKEDGSYGIYEDFTNDAMLELVLFIGAIHIFIGLLRYADKNWSNVGWAIAIVGGYLYFPVYIKSTSLIHYVFHVPPLLGSQIGLYLLFGGMGLATLLALIQKKLAGLIEPMNVIQVFADIMSYLRIYALALAGMIMGATFNRIGMKMPFYIAPFIILAGHSINFALAIIGGIIHGLRLNFIEWYHYSFEGGGKRFDPLQRLELD